MTKSKVLDKELQTLTAEEQRTLVANNGLGVAVAPLGDVEEAGDDEEGVMDVEEDDVVLGGGSDLELDA